jgi:hypothetical protein
MLTFALKSWLGTGIQYSRVGAGSVLKFSPGAGAASRLCSSAIPVTNINLPLLGYVRWPSVLNMFQNLFGTIWGPNP